MKNLWMTPNPQTSWMTLVLRDEKTSGHKTNQYGLMRKLTFPNSNSYKINLINVVLIYT